MKYKSPAINDKKQEDRLKLLKDDMQHVRIFITSIKNKQQDPAC